MVGYVSSHPDMCPPTPEWKWVTVQGGSRTVVREGEEETERTVGGGAVGQSC